MTPADVLRVGSIGLRSRRLRAFLSALGICVGISSVVGVLGISASSQVELLSRLDSLGTNLLSVSPGVQLGGARAHLPATAPGMIRRLGAVTDLAAEGFVPGAGVYRTDKIPSIASGGISVAAADVNLPGVLGATVAHGTFLNAATARYPAAVLGASAAVALGIVDLRFPVQISVGGQWFAVVGILDPILLASNLDRSVLVGYPAAERYLGFDGQYSTIYLRADPAHVDGVQALLARTADPAHPEETSVSRPSDLLVARAAAQSVYTDLFVGLGTVALLVGAVGVANVMVVGVLERRSEIGLRRALGATRGHVGLQFLTEAVLLSGIGGLGGVAAGALATALMSLLNGWPVAVPLSAVLGGLGSAVVVGMVAGLYPALRAARMAPSDALRTA